MKKLLIGAMGAALLLGCTLPSYAAAGNKPITADNAAELATKVAAEINTKDPSLEHGAFLYCNTTRCWSSRIVTGTGVNIPTQTMMSIYDEEDTDFMVGIIHSHPKSTSGTKNQRFLIDDLNKQPSLQDYLTMLMLSVDGLVFQETALYIVGPDTILRTYNTPRPPK